MVADWSELPSELMFEVAQNSKTVEDVITSSAVCRDWGHIFSMLKGKWSPKLPWIMLAEPGEEHAKINYCIKGAIELQGDDDCRMDLIVDNRHPYDNNPECIRNLFDPLISKAYALKLPETFGHKCFGSAYGWLFTIGLDLETQLFNPLTRSRISLPPQWKMPNQPMVSGKININRSFHCDKIWVRTYFIQKGIVLKLPYQSENFIVFIVHGGNDFLAFCRPGDLKWTEVNIEFVYDVIYWKHMFLILGLGGELWYIDYSDSLGVENVVTPKPYHELSAAGKDCAKDETVKRYLLEARDDIYMIVRTKSDSRDPDDGSTTYKSLSFDVFRLNTVCRTWEVVTDLENMAFFCR